MKKNVLLINPPIFENKRFVRSGYCNSISKGGYYWSPIDLLAQSGILKDDFNLFIIDAAAEKWNEEKTLKYLKNNIKELDGIFFITSLASRDYDIPFINRLKKIYKNPKILASAGYLLFDNKHIFKNDIIDGILLDYTSNETIDFFKIKMNNYKTISTKDNILTVNEIKFPETFSYPTPKHLDFPLNKYYMPTSKKLPMVNIITNLGCPFKCDFCTWSNLKYRQRNIENLISELKYLNKNKIEEIMFIDPTFGANKKYTFKLLNKIIEEKIKISYSIECRVDLISEEFINLLKKSGCHSITFGLESGSDEILKNIKKGFTTDTIKKAFKLCHQYKIKPTGHFIIGLPGETHKTVNQTIELAKNINCDFASFNIIMPLPGTNLYKKNIKNNEILSCSDTELPVTTNNTDLSPDEILKLSKYAFKKFYLRPKYILNTLLKMFNPTQFKIIIKEVVNF